MPVRLPGLEIREPLLRRPFYGALVGATTGGIFAALAQKGAFHVPRDAQTLGFLGGGVTVGAMIGFLLPSFRRRLTAGVAVGLSATVGLLVANHEWREFPDPLGSIGFGVIGALLYMGAFWDYRGPSK